MRCDILAPREFVHRIILQPAMRQWTRQAMRQRLRRRGTGEVFAKAGKGDGSPERSHEETARGGILFDRKQHFPCQSPDCVLCLFYRAIQEEFNCPVSVKPLPPAVAYRLGVRARCRRRSISLRSLRGWKCFGKLL